jgi:peptidyl-prolyl cis-trans isomerase B (cyclophilin B)
VTPNSKQERAARENRARVRGYQARLSVNALQQKRRKRDNLIAGASLALVLVLLVLAQLSYFNGGPGTPEATATATPTATPSDPAGANIGDVPSADLAENRTWTGSMNLNNVTLGFQLDGALAPQALASTITLMNGGFYEGVTCHRLTTGGFYVLQCGDPSGDGTGGPGYSYGPIENAPADDLYPAGTLAMARTGSNGYSMGSQFFIVYEDTTIPSDAAGGYTVLGTITSGLDQLKAQITDAGVQAGGTDGPPVSPVTITGATVQ